MAMVSLPINLKYHRRLFWWLLVYSWVLVGCFALFQYYREKRFKADELNAQLQLVNTHILSGISDSDTLKTPVDVGTHPFKELRISIIDTRNGKVLYDNSMESLPKGNHLDREEIRRAIDTGSGYAIRRHSLSTSKDYFYSARKNGKYIVRTAVPYSVNLQQILGPDYGFLWFMIGITTIMSMLGYLATRRVGQHVVRLKEFASKAEQGEQIYDNEPFPHDELGDISNNIVRLYAKLQQALASADKEHHEALHQEQEKIRIKRQLTNNINHELKTPVASIQACLETLLSHPELSEERRTEFLQRCSSACNRLRGLLADVAQLTRLEEGGEFISMEEVSITRIATEVCDETYDAARAKGIEIINRISRDYTITGSASTITSIFRNLIDNAINYSGGTQIELSVIDVNEKQIQIQVADNGIGVAPEHMQRLFERFYRVDKGRSRRLGVPVWDCRL